MADAFRADRFREAVAYVAWKMRDNPEFGRVKLAKTLFYADFESYAEQGEPLTGATYEHWEFGPFPPILYSVEKDLAASGQAKLQANEFAGDHGKLVSTEPPETPHLEEWHRHLLDIKMKELAEKPSWKVSEDSHEHPAWLLTGDREEIPYAAALVPKTDVSKSVTAVAKRRFRGLGHSH